MGAGAGAGAGVGAGAGMHIGEWYSFKDKADKE